MQQSPKQEYPFSHTPENLQEKEGEKRNAWKNWYRQQEEAFQRLMYRHAEFAVTSRRGRVNRGYLAILPILGVTLMLTWILQRLVADFVFEDGALVLALSLVALWWGWGPTFYLTFGGLLLLDFFFTTPGHLYLLSWLNVLQVVPFCLAGICIALLSFQRDKGWVLTHHYARELEAARQQLESEAQLKDRFLSITAHELKTPVTGIRMQSQILQRRLRKQSTAGEAERTLQALEKIDERTQFLTSMINELLEFCQTLRQQITLERTVCDLNALCQEVIENQRSLTGRSVSFQPAPPPAYVYGDSHRLEQVVSNLVTNAIKYSPASAPVEVSGDHDAQQIRIHVRDYGQGLDQDQLNHIFEPFYRTPDAQSSTVGGLGLGLAITKQIVDLHEGQIWGACEEGHGCTFCVQLPLRSRTALIS